jgi:hypothetical protein
VLLKTLKKRRRREINIYNTNGMFIKYIKNKRYYIEMKRKGGEKL